MPGLCCYSEFCLRGYAFSYTTCRIVIIINMDIVELEAPVIGNPQPYPSDPSAMPENPTPTVQPQPYGGPSAVTNGPTGGYGHAPPSQPIVKPSPGGMSSGPSQGMGGGGYGSGYGGGGQPGHQPGAAIAGAAPPPRYGGQGPVVKNDAAIRIVPIDALNPYMGKWTIKARVTSKGQMRRYHNAKGEGKVFSFDLLDAQGGEIRVTAFNKEVDQFMDKIQVSGGAMGDVWVQVNYSDHTQA